jgi:hypothetical protein
MGGCCSREEQPELTQLGPADSRAADGRTVLQSPAPPRSAAAPATPVDSAAVAAPAAAAEPEPAAARFITAWSIEEVADWLETIGCAATQIQQPEPAPRAFLTPRGAATLSASSIVGGTSDSIWCLVCRLGQYRQNLVGMGADGFMLSRMEAEDLEDAIHSKEHCLAIVAAAKAEADKIPKTRPRNYGKVLGHDRDD